MSINPFHKLLQAIWKEYRKFNFIENIHRVYHDFDDPQIFQYSASINVKNINTDGFKTIITCTGTSINNEEEALAKCLIEALERKAGMVYKKSDLINSSFNNLIRIKKNVINPIIFSSFSKKQLKQKKYKIFNINNNTVIYWKEAYCLNTHNIVLIPAELIYFNFVDYRIMIPITTGLSAGLTKEEAILRGIYEIIERDAFIIRYLSKTTGRELIFKKLDIYNKIKNICKKYRFEIRFIDLTIDLPIPTVLALLINQSNVGPKVSIGIKTYHSYKEALYGSFLESLQTRTWTRHYYEDFYEKKKEHIKLIRTLNERAMYWYNKEMTPYLYFFIDHIKKIYITKEERINSSSDILYTLVKKLDDAGHMIYTVDLTPSEYKNIPIYVVKVIIPTLQPLYLNEEFPYLGGKRLNNITNSFNKIPHPFL